MKRLILASASPRRKELLEKMGMPFTVLPAGGEEIITKEEPGEVVEELALQKARATAALVDEEALIIGSDTVVAMEGKILGKPGEEAEAVSMLTMLQGRTHQVYTGVALLLKQGAKEIVRVFHEHTKVSVYPMTQEEIAAYVATKEPMDKAGAYGIQGQFALYVKEISGDYFTIVGFPLSRVYQEMKKMGIRKEEISPEEA